MCDFRVVTRFGKSHRAGISVLITTGASLHPQSLLSHQGSPCFLESEVSLLNLTNWFLGLGIDRNACKVSVLDSFCSIDICRYNLDATTSLSWSIDPIAMLRGISGWLRDPIVSQVSRFADLYALDLELPALPSTPNVSVWTVCKLDGWPGRHQ